MNVKDIVDNKKFWKTVKSFFSDKSNNFENISLIENGNLLIDNFIFSFKTVSLTDIEKETKILNTNKASHSSDIPTIVLKQNVDFFSPFILGYVNKLISSSTFPSILKLADVIPVYKKDSRPEKRNYRSICVLPNLSKILENVLYDQISSFFWKHLF